MTLGDLKLANVKAAICLDAEGWFGDKVIRQRKLNEND
jgi:hypothetical protein